VPLEWGCRRTPGKGERLSLVLLVLSWGTKFWHDLYCGDTILNEVFPDLFGIAHVKDVSAVDNMEILGGFT
jgi:hypothetical protein